MQMQINKQQHRLYRELNEFAQSALFGVFVSFRFQFIRNCVGINRVTDIKLLTAKKETCVKRIFLCFRFRLGSELR